MTGECLLAMLQISPGRSIEFVARFLENDEPALVEAAAPIARQAVAASDIYRSSESTVGRVRAAAEERRESDLTETVEELVG